VVGGLGNDSRDSVANCCAEVNDVSKPKANGVNVITAPVASPG